MARLIAPWHLLLPLLLPLCALADEPADQPAEEQAWGSLSGQLLYNGEPPVPMVFLKGGLPILDESLLVDPKTRGLANCFVYLRSKPMEKLPVHPGAMKAAKQPVTFAFDGVHFTPHAFTLQTGQQLTISNPSPLATNVKIEFFKNPPINPLVPPGKKLDYKFMDSESLPVNIRSNIYLWANAFLLVRDNPYVAITDKDGRFEIKHIPAGEYEFQFWHERSGYPTFPSVKLRGAELPGKPDRGRFRIKIQAGENNLGEIKLDPKQFDN